MAVLKWHGGKHYLAEQIVRKIPPHTHYVEPFFGSGAVLFAKPENLVLNHSEVINDIHKELTIFYCVLRNRVQFEEFKRIVDLTPFSEVEWEHACAANPANTPVQRAVKFFIRYRQSRQGIGKSFATLSRNRTRRGMNEQVSSWLSAIDGLDFAHNRLSRVAILNKHANDVILSQDGFSTFFYLDPPYLKDTRSAKEVYEHEMSKKEHIDLLDILSNVEGKFILSGYEHTLYTEVAERNRWKKHEVILPNNASGDQLKESRTECLWYNY
jgi:DNA adenine methylase